MGKNNLSFVWINSIVLQNEDRHKQANQIIHESSKRGCTLSLLNIQEILFVLAKLKIDPIQITSVRNDLLLLEPKSHNINHMQRATELVEVVGFRHINDCLHTAIAEENKCTLITYNNKDFKKIRLQTSMEIIIL